MDINKGLKEIVLGYWKEENKGPKREKLEEENEPMMGAFIVARSSNVKWDRERLK